MAPVVYLHIGAPKTGTSFLQDILWSNRDILAQSRVTLPGTRRTQYQATVDVRELPLNNRSPNVDGSWTRITDEILTSSGTCVVSHELFSGASEKQARRAVESLQPAEVHIVYTARDLKRQIAAEWQQKIKHRGRVPMGEFMDDVVTRGPRAAWFWHVQDPAAVLRRWSAILPPERVHLVTVPTEGADFSQLWHRFASLIGVNPDGYDVTTARTNSSLGAVEAELLRRVNIALGDRLPLRGPHDRFVKQELALEVLAKRDNKVRFGVRPHRWMWLTEETQRIVDELKSLGCDVVGDLDELRPAEQPLLGHPDEVGDAALVEVGTDAMAAVLERLRVQTIRAEAAERRVRKAHVEVTRLRKGLSTGNGGTVSRRKPTLAQEVVALKAELEARRRRPVKHALLDLGERHTSLTSVRRRCRRVINAMRTLRSSPSPRSWRRSG